MPRKPERAASDDEETRVAKAVKPVIPVSPESADTHDRFGSSPRLESPKKIGAFQALHYSDFRLLWTGTIFSSAALWIQQATMSWLAYSMTGSGTILGSIQLMRAIPALLLAPLGGLAADRFNRKYLMLATQVMVFILALAMGTGLALNQIGVPHLFIFFLLSGTFQTLNMPVRQTAVFDLVPRNVIPNAIAINSAGTNFTRTVGPTIAGFMIAYLGPAGNFFVQSAAYLGVIISILMIKFPPQQKIPHGESWVRNLAEGFVYVGKTPTIRTVVLMGLTSPLLLIPCVMTLPTIFA